MTDVDHRPRCSAHCHVDGAGRDLTKINDQFISGGKLATNRCGGVLGGISTGSTLEFRIAVKPTPSVSIEQKTVNRKLEETVLQVKGRHDPCIVPRIVPVVEAMTAIVLCDLMLRARSSRID
jgi:chorismate synthase